MKKYAIAIHGGAGTILRSNMIEELELEYKKGLQDALEQGYKILEKGGSSIEAVEKAIVCMENNPLFNAGKGSVFTHDGRHEMDASIMNGNNLEVGAIAGVTGIRNPIILAKTVLTKSEHVLLFGKGAEEFAREQKIIFEDDAYFYTKQRYEQLLEIRDSEITQLDHSAGSSEKKFGTVGAVALDVFGNLAAGTSTGGMTNKRFGRVGDSPIIGAGTYANNKTCAVSCTGHGEFFIKAVAAYDVSCLIEYKGFSLKQACEEVVHHKLVELGGEGGLIAIDSHGNIELIFNTEGMYRGKKESDGDYFIEIYKDAKSVS